jgi:hypothetical protein
LLCGLRGRKRTQTSMRARWWRPRTSLASSNSALSRSSRRSTLTSQPSPSSSVLSSPTAQLHHHRHPSLGA